MRRNLAELFHDVGALSELQIQLLLADAHDARRKTQKPLMVLIVAGAVAMATVPVLLLAVAHLLVEAANWPPWGAYLVVSLVVVAGAGVAVKLAVARLRKIRGVFTRSRGELKQNVRWVRQALKAHGRAERMGINRPREQDS